MAAILYEAALIVREKRDTAGNLVDKARIVKEPFYFLAKDDTDAKIQASQYVPTEVGDDDDLSDRLEVITRPF